MRCTSSKSRPIAIAIVVLMISGCRGAGGTGPSPMLPVANRQHAQTTSVPKAKHKIDHIVIVIQENRTLANLFYDYPNAHTSPVGFGTKSPDATPFMISIQSMSLATNWDFIHGAAQFITDCNGKGPKRGQNCRMDGFNREGWYCGHAGEPKCPIKYPPYSYVPHDEILPYLDMANQYVLAAQMYASNFDMSSFISHQYIIAGINPNSSTGYPEGKAWGCSGGKTDVINILPQNRAIPKATERACWTPPTIGQELDDKKISWAYYASAIPPKLGGKSCGSKSGPDVQKGYPGIWSAYQAIKYICYGDNGILWNTHIKSPSKSFLTDVEAGNLAAVTWITPRYSNSDHPGNGSDTGPSWVSSLVNAIGKSKFWGSTAIFIFWDDPGGLYDPAPPAYLDDDSLGFRLPLLIISPYAKQGWVSQVHYEHGSILRFIEDRFGLAVVGPSDARATSPAKDCFDFSQPPRKFVPIKSKYPETYFLHEPDDYQPPDND